MPYPLIEITIDAELQLMVPDPDLIQSTYQQLKQVDASTPFPFWARIWASSLALKQYLQDHLDMVEQQTVLEIGAGIGVPSFAIRSFAHTITITDYDANAVALMQYNIEQLHCTNMKALKADWTNFPLDLQADIVLLSDVNYAPDQYEPLLALIQRFINAGATIIIATPERMSSAPFLTMVQSFVQYQTIIPINQDHQVTLIGLFVLKASGI